MAIVTANSTTLSGNTTTDTSTITTSATTMNAISPSSQPLEKKVVWTPSNQQQLEMTGWVDFQQHGDHSKNLEGGEVAAASPSSRKRLRLSSTIVEKRSSPPETVKGITIGGKDLLQPAKKENVVPTLTSIMEIKGKGVVAPSVTITSSSLAMPSRKHVAPSKPEMPTKGVPWTEDEHRLFLLGLCRHGKGDWRSISREFVSTRSPTQVASHAQKFYIRHANQHKQKRRPSILDITIPFSYWHIQTPELYDNFYVPFAPTPSARPHQIIMNWFPSMGMQSSMVQQSLPNMVAGNGGFSSFLPAAERTAVPFVQVHTQVPPPPPPGMNNGIIGGNGDLHVNNNNDNNGAGGADESSSFYPNLIPDPTNFSSSGGVPHFNP